MHDFPEQFAQFWPPAPQNTSGEVGMDSLFSGLNPSFNSTTATSSLPVDMFDSHFELFGHPSAALPSDPPFSSSTGFTSQVATLPQSPPTTPPVSDSRATLLRGFSPPFGDTDVTPQPSQAQTGSFANEFQSLLNSGIGTWPDGMTMGFGMNTSNPLNGGVIHHSDLNDKGVVDSGVGGTKRKLERVVGGESSDSGEKWDMERKKRRGAGSGEEEGY